MSIRIEFSDINLSHYGNNEIQAERLATILEWHKLNLVSLEGFEVNEGQGWEFTDWYFSVNLSAHGDYIGGIIEKSNYIELTETYGFGFSTSDYGTSSASLGFNDVKALNEDEWSLIVEIVDSLADYPCLNDETYEIEAECLNDNVKYWINSDLESELYKITDNEIEVSNDETIELLYKLTEDHGLEFEGFDLVCDIENLAKLYLENSPV